MSGFRINPVPQQAIYQAHNSSCGQNRLIYDPILVIDNETFYFIDLKDILFDIMNSETTIAALDNAIAIGTNYLVDPIPDNRLLYIDSLFQWAQTLFGQIEDKTPINGYTYVLTVYNYNGNTIWDSATPTLTPTTNTIPPQYTIVPLIQPNPLTGNPSTWNLYGINNTPAAIGWINGNSTGQPYSANGALAQISTYLVNQAIQPESVMAIASLLTDPANTRVYGFPRYGFSARQNTNANNVAGQLGFYCCYLNELYSNPIDANNNTSTLFDYIFVRIGLVQDIAAP
jgi:hypothetical protein